MSTLKTSNIQHASAASAAITLDANGQATLNGLAYPTSGSLSGRNRIINGDMRIDQRNAGASLTVNSGTDFFAVDRFTAVGTSSAGVFTVQQSSTAPSGFTNSLVATVTTADATLAAADQYYISQIIEGNNVADLAWGSASASTVTLSFWVRSSVTGTFSGSFRNSATNRAYPFTYAISAANTWENKSITISGDTSGTWLTTNGVGVHITWGLGFGSNFTGAAGSWSANNYKGATSATNLMATNGATFYITGVQLEAGSVATPFERRSYGQELSLCQRYYQKIKSTGASIPIFNGYNEGSVNSRGVIPFRTSMRTNPSALETSGTASDYEIRSVSTITCSVVPSFETATTENITVQFTVSSGLTNGYSNLCRFLTSNGFLAWSAEL